MDTHLRGSLLLHIEEQLMSVAEWPTIMREAGSMHTVGSKRSNRNGMAKFVVILSDM
jgi:hypothetical protein